MLPSSAALLASLARKPTKRAASRADIARGNLAMVDALPEVLRHYWQGSASYLMDQDVAAGREIVIDGTETRESVAEQARALMGQRTL